MDRISLANSAFEGNNNVYVLESDSTTALVDTGDPAEETREQFEATLAEQDRSFADIDVVFLTHWHGDHTGLAATIQEESNATVYAHEADADLIRDDEDAWERMEEKQRAYFEEWGMPEEKQAVLRERMQGDTHGDGAEVETFTDGATFRVGEYELTARHTSGHAAGLSCYVFENGDSTEVFSGDALLPVYTPNVGGADVRVDRPLENYLEALAEFVSSDYDTAWPGHRDPIEDPAARAEHIIEHHEERAWRVLDVLREHGSLDAWTVSAELFGELESIHILHGPGEAYAHLEHLERAGLVERTGDEYDLAAGTAGKMDARDSESWPLIERDPV